MEDAPVQQSMCNKEGEILATPLPESWTLERLKNAGDLPVTLFGNLPSPSNFRLRYIMKFYGIPFTVVEAPYAKVDKTWEYKKMPVLRIGKKEDVAEANKKGDVEKGRIINDGYVAINALAPACQGRPLTDEEIKVEKYFTFGMQYNLFFGAVKAGKFGPPNPGQVFPHCNCCNKCCLNCCFGCCCPYCIFPCCCNYMCCSGGKIEGILKGNAALLEDGDYIKLKSDSFVAGGKKLAEMLGDKEFFAGGELGLVDVDLFGFIHYNVAQLKNPYAIKFIDADSRLQNWYNKMKGGATAQVSAFNELQYLLPKDA